MLTITMIFVSVAYNVCVYVIKRRHPFL